MMTMRNWLFVILLLSLVQSLHSFEASTLSIPSEMNKSLEIKKISVASVKAAEICRILDEAGVEFLPVDNHCWADAYPYRPTMEVRMAHNGDQLLINYRVTEECVRAVAPHDDGNVWEDSCCELFLSPIADGTYYNLECNAAGQLLIGFGAERNNRERAPQAVLNQIDRWTTMGREPFADIEGERTWQLSLVVPTTAYYRHSLASFDGLKAKGNVYKCGDCLPHPHFLSFFPIDLPKPDFHRPDFFGAVNFE